MIDPVGYRTELRHHLMEMLRAAAGPLTLSDLTEQGGKRLFSRYEARVMLLEMASQGIVNLRVYSNDIDGWSADYEMTLLQKLAAL